MRFNREDYGSRIRSLRKKRGLTQEQLAEKMNVSTPYIAKIETGKQTGPVELAVEFAAFFDVSLDYLLVGKGDFAEEQKRGLRIASELREEGVPCKSGEVAWDSTAIRYIIMEVISE